MAGDIDKAVEAALEVVIKAWVPSISESSDAHFVYSIAPDYGKHRYNSDAKKGYYTYTDEKSQDIADVIVEVTITT